MRSRLPEAKEDWEILTLLGRLLGLSFLPDRERCPASDCRGVAGAYADADKVPFTRPVPRGTGCRPQSIRALEVDFLSGPAAGEGSQRSEGAAAYIPLKSVG